MKERKIKKSLQAYLSSFSKETLTTAIIYCDHFDFIIETSKKIKEERFFKLRLAEWVNRL